MVAETEMARDSENIAGHPKILPVRAAYTLTLPLRFRAAIGHLHHFEWRDSTDNETLLAAILAAMAEQEVREPVADTSPSAAPAVSSLSKGKMLSSTQRSSLWQPGRTRESLAGTTMVAVVAGEETSLSVTRATGPGFFRVRVLSNGALEVAIWSGAGYRRVRNRLESSSR